MTVYYILVWGLGNVEYTFITITLRSTLNQSGSSCIMSYLKPYSCMQMIMINSIFNVK